MDMSLLFRSEPNRLPPASERTRLPPAVGKAANESDKERNDENEEKELGDRDGAGDADDDQDEHKQQEEDHYEFLSSVCIEAYPGSGIAKHAAPGASARV